MTDELKFARKGGRGDPDHQYNLRQIERWARQARGDYIPKSAFIGAAQHLVGTAAGAYTNVLLYQEGNHGSRPAADYQYQGVIYRSTDVGDDGLISVCTGDEWYIPCPQVLQSVTGSAVLNGGMAGAGVDQIILDPQIPTMLATQLPIGTTFRFQLMGDIDHPAVAEAFNFRGKVGVNTAFTLNAAADATARTGRNFELEGMATIKSLGGSGTFAGKGTLHHLNGAAAATDFGGHSSGGTGVIDLTGFFDVQLTIAFAVSNANRVMRATQGSIEIARIPAP